MSVRTRRARHTASPLGLKHPPSLVEPLEARTLLAAHPPFAALADDRTLMVSGTPADDTIHLTTPGDGGEFVITLNGSTLSFDQRNVHYIILDADDGNDVITLGGRSLFADLLIRAGDGDDRIVHSLDTITPPDVDGGGGRDTAVLRAAQTPDQVEFIAVNATAVSGARRLRHKDLDQIIIEATPSAVEVEVDADGLAAWLTVVASTGADRLTVSGHAAVPVELHEGDVRRDLFLVTDGSLSFDADAGPWLNQTTWRVGPGGTVRFNAPQQLTALRIDADGRIIIAPGGANTLLVDVNGRPDAFVVTPGVLDLNDNALIIRRSVSPESLAGAPIRSARNGAAGAWSGNGITSSTVATRPGFTLAAVTESPVNSVHGQPVRPDDILVIPARDGDANLDGTINLDDYFAIDRGALTGGRRWQDGDFNYDGQVNGADYLLINSGFATQHTPQPILSPSTLIDANDPAPASPSSEEPLAADPPSACPVITVNIGWTDCLPRTPSATIDRVDGDILIGVRLNIPDPGYHLDWGTIHREGNLLIADARMQDWTGPVVPATQSLSHLYDLGPLEPAATYTFILRFSGHQVLTRTFKPQASNPVTPLPVAPVLSLNRGTGTNRYHLTATATFIARHKQVILDWGTFRRTDETSFILDTKPAIAENFGIPESYPISYEYDLGMLPPGLYTVTFRSWGADITTATFTVEEPFPATPLRLYGSPDHDVFRIERRPETDDALLWWDNAPPDQPQPLVIDLDSIWSILLDAGEGDDTLILDHAGGAPLKQANFHGGPGFDRLVAINLPRGRGVSISDTAFESEARVFLSSLEYTSLGHVPSGSLTASGNAIVVLDELSRWSRINLRGSARVTLAADQSAEAESFTMESTATLDVRGHTLTLWSTPAETVQTLATLDAAVRSGRHTGLWDGTELTSTRALLDPSRYVVAAIPTGIRTVRLPFRREEQRQRITIRAALLGDLNLDHVVDAEDRRILDDGFRTRATRYHHGDLNFDGEINLDDYFLLDSLHPPRPPA